MLDFPHSSPDGGGEIRDISVINLKTGQNWGDRTQSPLRFSLSSRGHENEVEHFNDAALGVQFPPS